MLTAAMVLTAQKYLLALLIQKSSTQHKRDIIKIAFQKKNHLHKVVW
jgi:hypothetical protein